jgi:hypothetical protein
VADATNSMTTGGATLWVAIAVVLAIIVIVAFWRMFQKAGRPGWAAIIPVYNTYTLIKVAGRPGWWLLLYFIPVVNLIIHVVVCIGVAKAFGRSTVFGVVGLWLFSVIGYMMLGFGSDQYQGARPQIG